MDEHIKDIAQDIYDQNQTSDQFAVAQIGYHTHNGSDSPKFPYPNLTNRSRFILHRILSSTTNTSVANGVGGNLVMPFGGNFINVGFTVDTAGTTGSMVVDFLLNGKSILFTKKISIASGSNTTRNTLTQTFAIPNFKIGDIMTFNVTSVQSTPAMGLTIFMRVNETTP